jgi:hypothetical protein
MRGRMSSLDATESSVARPVISSGSVSRVFGEKERDSKKKKKKSKKEKKKSKSSKSKKKSVCNEFSFFNLLLICILTYI